VQISENDRGTPGSGHIQWAALLGTLRDLEYDGWLTIESFGPSLGAFSAAVAIWRDIEPTPESIAFDGISFLRRTLASLVQATDCGLQALSGPNPSCAFSRVPTTSGLDVVAPPVRKGSTRPVVCSLKPVAFRRIGP
jgi:hypothetical protein